MVGQAVMFLSLHFLIQVWSWWWLLRPGAKHIHVAGMHVGTDWSSLVRACRAWCSVFHQDKNNIFSNMFGVHVCGFLPQEHYKCELTGKKAVPSPRVQDRTDRSAVAYVLRGIAWPCVPPWEPTPDAIVRILTRLLAICSFACLAVNLFPSRAQRVCHGSPCGCHHLHRRV